MVRNRNAGIAVGAIAVVLIVSGGLDWAFDMAFYPWARANPSLFGVWTGPLTTGTGERLLVVLELRRARTGRDLPCTRCNQIEGTAATCDAHGTVLRYQVSGSPSDRRGTQLQLGAKPVREPAPDGLELDVLRGSWDGADRLAFDASFFWRRNGSGISTTGDPATRPVALAMRRGAMADFDAMCGRQAPV